MRGVRTSSVPTAAVSAAASSASATSAAPATPSPTPTVLTEAAVLAVVQQTSPPTANGVAGGCDTGPCPFTDRLKQELAHLSAQTPAPGQTGDLCNFDRMTGNQDGMATPVHAAVAINVDTADAAVSMKGQTQPIVTLPIIDSDGVPLVDDILYDSQQNRSVYTLNCTNSFG